MIADISTKRPPTPRETTWASVVLPVPGGPHSSTDDRPARLPVPLRSTSRRSGDPAREQVLLADDLVQRARPHPHRERRGRTPGRGVVALLRVVRVGRAEQVGHAWDGNALRRRRGGP